MKIWIYPLGKFHWISNLFEIANSHAKHRSISKAAGFSAGCLSAVTYAHPQLVIIRNLVCFPNTPKLLTKQECPVHNFFCRVQKLQKKRRGKNNKEIH
jgi:hypothetical protein